jgi:hypothetical protein
MKNEGDRPSRERGEFMTADEFRALALALPEATEGAHMGHPDFRVGGKVFATLGPKAELGMVKVAPEQQRALLEDESGAYYPASGAWGRRGCTMVRLELASEPSIEWALTAAWRDTAPIRLLQRDGDRGGLRSD